MAREHYCGDDGWQPGGVDQCDKHGQRVVNMPQVRMSGKDRRKADGAAGVVGTDRGGYVNG